MKKYSLVTRWVSDQPDIQCNLDTLEELLQDSLVKSAMDAPHFYKLSVRKECISSSSTPSYSMFTLVAEYHDGYVYKELGNLIKYPIKELYTGYPAKICPANCGDFDPVNELTLSVFDYYNWIVYELIGNSGAFVVEKLFQQNTDIDIIKKFIEDEIEYQSIHPPIVPKIKSVNRIRF